jgi:lipid A ethanolaminephosphotransferase
MQFPMLSFSASRLLFLVATALWVSILPNIVSVKRFIDSPSAGDGVQAFAFVLGGWLAVVLATFTLLSLLGFFFWGRSVKLLCAIALIASAILGYFSFFLGTQFDKTMFANIVQTHTSEATELISVRLIAWVVVVGVLPALFLWRVPLVERARWFRHTMNHAAVWLALLLVTLAALFSQYSRYASAARNRDITFHTMAPTNFIAAAVSHYYALREQSIVRDLRGIDAQQKYKLPKPRLVVFVVGETARAQNFGLNGYARDNTPRMREEGVLYFRDTESCGTATAISLPCMFSGLNREDFSISKARAVETLVDVVLHANVRMIWLDNDGGCKGVCDRADVKNYNRTFDPRWCSEEGECYDEVMLEGLKAKIEESKQDTLLVLHVKGSHGPAYYKRYPPKFEKFTPTCKTNDLSACDRQHVVNAYDNTILYTDHVLGEVVTLLKGLSDQFATAMLYASDHGESLGENGLYLHGLPYAVAPLEQKRVPMLAWISPQFAQMERWDPQCLAAQTKKQRSHDNIYSTVLGLMEIDTKEYSKTLDIFEDCDTQPDPATTSPKR